MDAGRNPDMGRSQGLTNSKAQKFLTLMATNLNLKRTLKMKMKKKMKIKRKEKH